MVLTLYIIRRILIIMPRKPMTPDEVNAVRAKACRAATDLFAEHGSTGMSMRAIASRLGVSAMALYRYFPGGKDDVLAAVRTAAFGRLADCQEAAGQCVHDPAERFFRLGSALVQFMQDEPNIYRMLFELPQFDDGTYAEMDEQAFRAWGPITTAVADAVETGVLAGNPIELANLFFAGMHGVISLHLS